MINFNGTLLLEEKQIELHNRGLNYGDAVFETMKVSGGKIFFWEDHYFRLMASMRILRMEIPMNFTMEFLQNEIFKTLESEKSDTKTFRVKMLVWRKTGGKYRPATNNVEYAISFETLKIPFYTLEENEYEVELFKDHYINSGLLSTIKTTGKIVNILGSIYASENEYDNCLLINEDKQIVEALNGNIFLVKENQIKTPPLSDGCLNGIMRKQIISLLKNFSEYTFEEASISPFELQKADEIFITNVIVGIRPITKFRKKEFSTTVAKNLISRLNAKARLD
ncbi:aminotransferase class IV [Aequorivita echinoideorum]|uniref:branched-chain-amino-acid transaminase n=1 Tax=Aequorivita echinoideorum TaxID=1549647 RepID=A0ABS5S4M8_9FLAO|nr:aminotransferase class IV [Aequorivita echinoideorum]MBT0608171.1 aminotransferase class IV [Aequorivita echinoideorum]